MAEGQGSTEAADTKVCPDCAERVQDAARVCRYCGYEFDTGTPGRHGGTTAARPPAAASKSAAGAAVLSFVIPGLGHFYLGEGWRGGVFLASFVVATIGAFATDTIGPGWIIGIIGAVDAYRGAQGLRSSHRPRDVSGGLWAMLAIVIVLVALGVVTQTQRAADDQGAYEGCVAEGLLNEQECADIYLAP